MVTNLVHIGAKLELQDSMGRTGLYTAAKHGFTEVVDFLLAAGSELRMKNKGGYTPVNVAANNGHREVVQLLLDRGADTNTCISFWITFNISYYCLFTFFNFLT
jgi:ankyrin repeat protein